MYFQVNSISKLSRGMFPPPMHFVDCISRDFCLPHVTVRSASPFCLLVCLWYRGEEKEKCDMIEKYLKMAEV